MRTLNPGSFALVMATGIVSVDLQQHHLASISTALLCLAALCYLALIALHLWRPVAVLAASLEPATMTGRRELALIAVVCWSVGVALYTGVAVFVAARLMLHPPRPADLSPPYWVAMGAAAITTVAGGRIVEMADAPMVSATRGLIAGASVVFWAFGTWLIPPLLAAGWWRHITHRIPLHYEVGWWSIVSPLGMYAAAGHDLGTADHVPIVTATGALATWPALAAWGLAFTAMTVHLVHRYTPSR